MPLVLPQWDYASSQLFSQMFYDRLSLGGNTISEYFPLEVFAGASDTFIKQYDAPKMAVELDSIGADPDINSVSFWRRKITTKAYVYPITISEIDTARSGFDIDMLVEKAYTGCALALDQIIINAFTGDVEVANGRPPISYPDSLYLPYDFTNGMTEYDQPENLLYKTHLNQPKVSVAADMMRQNGIYDELILLAPSRHLTIFQADPFIRNLDFNLLPGMAVGELPGYGQVSRIININTLPTNVDSKKADGTKVDICYLVATQYIHVATNMPWQMKTDSDALKATNTINMIGMYGATRREEAAVIAIEVAHIDSSYLTPIV
jgi:hypothetical protein